MSAFFLKLHIPGLVPVSLLENEGSSQVGLAIADQLADTGERPSSYL
jgi:hypothetical protein